MMIASMAQAAILLFDDASYRDAAVKGGRIHLDNNA